MNEALLKFVIIDSPFVGMVYTLGLGAVLYLAIRKPEKRWLITGAAAVAIGSIAAFVTLWTVSATNLLGIEVTTVTSVWVYLTFAALCLAVANLWRSAVVRKIIASVSIVLFLIVGTVGINSDFGLDSTVGDLVGISTQKTVTFPKIQPSPSSSPSPSSTPIADEALWTSWKAPQGMPKLGTTSQVIIPNTVSGFVSRPAGLYLPPAALVKNPPALPLVIMLMGQPGNPDPSFQAAALNAFAARHHGLAPIVLVADQLGNPALDPLCLDTAKYGKVATFLTTDVVNWARTHLHILQDAAHWTIAGYSNGGECALSLGAQFPETWANVLDISGEEYPGSENPAATLSSVFGGNRAAYEAVKPLNILRHHRYPDTTAIITVSSNDAPYLVQAKRVAQATRAAGWKITYFEVLNGGHVLGALNGGLNEGYRVLYPRLGLSEPGTTP